MNYNCRLKLTHAARRVFQNWAVMLLLAVLAFWLPATARAQTHTIVQQFFVPFPEADFQNSLKAIDTTGTPVGTTIETIIAISIGTSNTMVTYDHWEDGFENDLNNPIQTTTGVWGDGNTNNGVAPSHPTDILLPGDVILLTNVITLPRNPSVIAYDGRDRIGATKAVTVTHASWAITPGTVLMSGTEVYDSTRFGNFFRIPVGSNTVPSVQNFSYSSLHILASQNGTTVRVDTNADGIYDLTANLNLGDTYFVKGGVSAGAYVTSSLPVQVHELTGRIGSSYQSRTFAIRPFTQWDSSYYTPVGTVLSSETNNVFLYNPYTSNLVVSFATKVSSGTVTVPANANYKFPMPLNSGAHFFTTNSLPFYAVDANDTGGTNTANQTHDWGFALLPEAALTPTIVLGWAPGSDDLTAPVGPDANGSPVWVTPTKSTTIYVNYSGNVSVGPFVAANGVHYDTNFAVAVLGFQTIYNPTTRNMSGARIFTTDGTTFAAAWGEDSSKAGCCSPYFDAGFTIIPFPVPVIKKTATVVIDTDGDGLPGWGDTLEYNVHVANEGMLALGNVIVLDALPNSVSYVAGSTKVDGAAVADNTVPPSATAFPLDENGYLLPQILVGGFTDIKFRATINSGATSISNGVVGLTGGDPVGSSVSTPVIPSTNAAPPVTIAFSDASGNTVSSYLTNSSVYVTLTDTARNTNSGTAQSVSVTVTNSSNGDIQTITVTETGANTGVFRNTSALPMSTTAGGSAQDGTLLALAGNTLRVGYTDPTTGNSGSAQAQVTAAPLPSVTKTSSIFTDLNSDGKIGWGDTVQYTITVTNSSGATVTNPVVLDVLPASVSYVTSSTTTNGVAIADSGSTAFPLDETGRVLANIPAGGSNIIRFRVTVNSGTSVSNSVSVTTSNGTVQASSVSTVFPPPPSCTLNFSDTNGITVSSYTPASGVYVTLSDTSLNTDATTAQSVIVLVNNSSNGDQEFITLTETGVNTGVFRNVSPLPSSITTGTGAQDGTLYAQSGQTLSVSYTGSSSETCSASTTISFPTQTKKLYLNDTNQLLNRLDPVAQGTTNVLSTTTLSAPGSSTSTISVDSTTVSNAASVLSLTFPHTTASGANRFLVVGVSTDNAGTTSVTNVTYNGVALTALGTASSASGTPKPLIAMYGLTNPAVGTFNVVVSLSGSAEIVAGATTFFGVNQTNATGTLVTANASSGTPSVTVSSAAGELVVDTVSVSASGSPGASQTNLWTQTNTIIGGASTKAGAASVTMTWTANGKWAIGAVPLKPAPAGSGSGTNSTVFSQSLAMCKTFSLPSAGAVTVTNYINITSGSMPANATNITATLSHGLTLGSATSFIVLSNAAYNSGNGTLGFSGALPSAVTITNGEFVFLTVTTTLTNANFTIQYGATNKPSAISLPTTTVITVDSITFYDAAYPGGALLSSAFNNQTVYIRTVVSDPFGSYDVNHLNLSITDPLSGVLNATLTNSSVVVNDGCAKTYEYAWTTGSTQGNYALQATAFEGTEGITASAGTSIQVRFPDGGTPSTTTFITTNGVPTNAYTAGSTVCVKVVDADKNQDGTAIETVSIVVTTATGDSETFTLTETSTNSGIFSGCIAANTGGAVQNNGTLNAPAGTTLLATYTDSVNPLDVSTDHALVSTIVSTNPVLVLSKTLITPADGNVLLGSTVRFDIQVANPGSITVTNIKVTDTFPSSRLTFTSASAGPDSSSPAGTLTWTNVGPLASGQITNISTFFVSTVAGGITNTVTVTGTTNLTPVSAFATNVSPAISVTKTLVTPVSGSAFISNSVVYRIAVTNIGNTTITNWPLQDQFSPSCFQFVGASVTPSGAGGGTILWTSFPSLAPGASTNVFVTNLVIGACSPAVNNASVVFAVDNLGNSVPDVTSSVNSTNLGASVSGTVFFDANANGTNDAGDSTVYQAIVYGDLNTDGVRQATEPFATTGTNGQYQITSLAGGTYAITVDTNSLPSGVRPTFDTDGTNTANVISLTLTNGQATTNATFGYTGSGSIAGFVWEDVNGDGIRQTNEALLPNIGVFIDANGNSVLESGETSVTTAGDGTYTLPNLVSNSYHIAINITTLPSGVVPTYDLDGAGTPDVAVIVLGPAQALANANFGFQGSASLTGLVTDSLTGLPISGATVTVTDSLGGVQTVSTDGTGHYSIATLWIGPATVTASKTGYASASSNPTIVSGANTANEVLTPNTLTGTVTNTVSGLPIAGATVQVVDSANVTNVIVTDAAGHYGVTNIAAGAATITASKTGYSSSTVTPTIVQGANSQDIGLTSNTLNGTVTDAFTGLPISGATVTVVDVAAVTNIVSTDALGHYGVTNIAAGAAAISASKPGYTPTNATPTITVGANTVDLQLTANTLSGQVTDLSSGLPISGATVQIVDGSGTTNSVITDTTGHYSKSNVVAGAGIVTASATGYFPTNATPTFVAGANTVNLQLTHLPSADLAVFKAGPAAVLSGSNMVYTITVTNFGPTLATNVVVSDNLPTNVTFVSANAGGTTNGSGVVTWPAIATFNKNASVTFTVTVTAPATGTFTNSSAAASGTPDPDSSNNNGTAPASQAVTTIGELADVATTVSGPATVLATASYDYMVTVTNMGPAPALNVVASNTLPATATYVSDTGGGTLSGSVLTFPVIASLPAGGSTNITITVTAPVSGTLTNTAASTSDTQDPAPANNDGTAPSAIVITTVTPQSDVAVFKGGPTNVIAADTFFYTLTVTNAGPSTATNLIVEDALPANVTFVNASGGGTTNGGGLVVWPAIASLPNGGVVSLTLTVSAPADGSITNIATVSVGTPDPNPANNTSAPVVTTVTPQADLEVINDGPASTFTSTNFSYTITVTNHGPSTATNVTVTDQLPANLTFVSASGGGTNNAGLVTWPSIVSLTNGESATFTLTVIASCPSSYTNNASVASDTDDPDLSNNASGAVTTVTDNEPPTITCPADVSVNASLGLCVATNVNLGAPSASDDCGVATITNSAPSQTVFPVGTNVVTWTVSDASGNTATCSQQVIVSDTQAPSLTCPANVSVNASLGLCVATNVNLGAPTTSDNCGVSTVTNDAPASFAVGTNVVTWTVTDASGNTSTCSQQVIVSDTQAPSLTCPTDVSVNASLGLCVATNVNLGAPTTGDNCGVSTVTNNAASQTVFPVGTNVVTWTVTDASGNNSTCSQNVIVSDTQAPSLTCPANVSVPASLGLCVATNVNLGAPTTSDNCGVSTVTNNAASQTVFPVGTNVVTWTVTDASGNTSTCQQSVVVFDTQAPNITCPGDVGQLPDSGTNVATQVNLGTPITSDNCGVANVTSNAPAVFPLGTNIVIWTVTDLSGNTASCSQRVIVGSTLPPLINCPTGVTVPASLGLCVATNVNLGTPGTSGTCGNLTVTNNAPAAFPVGTNIVIWTVSDECAQSATCAQQVVVQDTQAPGITCPTDVNVNASLGLCVATNVVLGSPTTSDNCGVATVSSNAPVNFPVGTNVVTWTVTDTSGNTSTCSQRVIVNDTQAPSITCPVDVSVNASLGLCVATNFSLGSPTTSDNCGVATVSSNAPASFPVGTNVVIWTVTDVRGNTATCSQRVIVNDAQVPGITCPVDVSVNASLGLCVATNVALGSPTTSDNCGVATVSSNAPASFPVGTNVVLWTVTDVRGNTATCSQRVIVNDTQVPGITCPADVSVNASLGLCVATNVSLGSPTTSDNCGVSTVTNNAPASFAVGTNVVVWTVTDASGNTATCSQRVIVSDTQAPSLTCPADVNTAASPGLCTATNVVLGAPSTSDNCGVSTVTNNAPSQTVFPVGTNVVTWTVTDASGNTSTCSQNVIVTDTQAPSLTCPADVNTAASPGLCTATNVALSGPTVSDNCGVSTVTNNASASFAVGTNVVVWTVTDASGNTATCSQKVVVSDTQAPRIGTNSDLTLPASLGLCSATNVSLTPPAATDNCGVASVTNNAPASFPAGTNVVVWTATDTHGNTATSLQRVIVLDTQPPVITCPANITVNGTPGQTTQSVTFTVTATDNCGLPGVVSVPASGSAFPMGTTTVTNTATDASGNTSTCTFTVTVLGADVAIVKSGPTGVAAAANFSYTVTVNNNGPSTATNVVVSDVLPGNVSFVSASGGGSLAAGTVTWTVASLASGASTNFTLTVTAPASGSITNVATVSVGTPDPNATNNTSAQVVTTVGTIADLAIGKTGPATVIATSNLNYTISLTNFGPSTATSVTVTDSLPVGVAFVSASAGGTVNGGAVVWALGDLASGTTTNLTLTVTAPANGGTLTNVASVGSPTGDPTPTNNVTPPVTTAVIPQTDIAVLKTGPATVNAASTFNYTVTVTNGGPSTATNVVVSDHLPGSLTFVSASGSGNFVAGTVTWPAIASLPNGSVVSFTVTVSAPARWDPLESTCRHASLSIL